MIAETRHPHPHIDPRQPRDGARPVTNPPVLAWKPPQGGGPYDLVIARDPGLAELALCAQGLADPAYLPEKALPVGTYYWSWSLAGEWAPTFSFEITADAVTVEVPPASAWLASLSGEHPRLYVGARELAAFRASRHGARAELWRNLQPEAEALLQQPHEIAEPPYLPDRRLDYEAFFRVWSVVLWDSRRFVEGAEVLALAYLASGEARYGRAAAQRMASISRWDPDGSSYLEHNDEAHMSVIWHGPHACDWAWDQFTDEERARVIAQFRRRGQITYEHMHSQGSYGITRFDSHAGREIVFLANIAFVFHEHIPEAAAWLDWLRPVLCGIWPIWAGDDGAWAEGPSYGLAYVTIMTMFATALKRGVGVDLYRRRFWANHARWRQWIWPPYAEWFGFGDHSERWRATWESNADLVELIGRESGAAEFADYVAAFRAEALTMDTPVERQGPVSSATRYVVMGEPAPTASAAAGREQLCRVFPAAGWAAIRSHRDDPSRDVALVFRSSPFGAISHSHANNNDFFLHVAGKIMAMPSGYYAGYGSAHHAHWVWHTKSHNCVTLSDAGQLMRSHDSRGSIDHAYEDERLVYFVGNADASYADRAARCRRHVIWLKGEQAFLLVDEFVAKPGVTSALQWNIHSWAPFQVDEAARSFALERAGSRLVGHLLYHNDAFFSLSEGWDPAPGTTRSRDQWHNQYHLRFTPSALEDRRTLGVVLCPAHAGLAPAVVSDSRQDGVEVAQIGASRAWIRQDQALERSGGALALLETGQATYAIGDQGIEELGS